MKLLSAGGGEAVVLELTGQITARFPFPANEAGALESMQRRVQRAVFDGEDVVGRLPNVVRDPPAVRRTEAQGFEDEHVERTGQQLEFLFSGSTPAHRGLDSRLSTITMQVPRRFVKAKALRRRP